MQQVAGPYLGNHPFAFDRYKVDLEYVVRYFEK